MVSSALLAAVKVVLLSLLLLTSVVKADYFTYPPSFTTQGTTYINVQTLDLSYNVTLGQTVQITWYSPALDGAYISLTIAHWDTDGNATTPSLRSLITNSLNLGYYTWTVGAVDGITTDEIAISKNFVFRLTDVNGNRTSTGNPPGFIDHTLTSRGFIVLTTKTNSSTNTTSSCPTSTGQSGATQSTCSQHKLTDGALAGIVVCAVVAALALAALAWVLHRQRQLLAGRQPSATTEPKQQPPPIIPYELDISQQRHEMEQQGWR